MDKKYQIFISSTKRDLINERNAVSKIILDLDHIPAGMELFPASDTEQFEYIKKVIDQCDYYILILAGKYGSVSSTTGISYTEMEYDYAVSSGKIVLGFPHEDISKLQGSQIEADDEDKRKKLLAFRTKVTSGKLVRFWLDEAQLAGHVAVSLSKAIAQFPQVGWVRGDSLADIDAVRQVNAKNAEIEALRNELSKLRTAPAAAGFEDIAGLEDDFDYVLVGPSGDITEIQVLWSDLALKLLKKIVTESYGAFSDISRVLMDFNPKGYSEYRKPLADDVLRVFLQLQLLGIIKKISETAFMVTPGGEHLMLTRMVARKPSSE